MPCGPEASVVVRPLTVSSSPMRSLVRVVSTIAACGIGGVRATAGADGMREHDRLVVLARQQQAEGRVRRGAVEIQVERGDVGDDVIERGRGRALPAGCRGRAG